MVDGEVRHVAPAPPSDPMAQWVESIRIAAARNKVPPLLVAAVVATESSGAQYAQRVERGFASRYAAGIAALVKRTVFRADEKWAQYPDIFCSSIGLMQIMIPTAIEHGFVFTYPGELFEPSTNLDIGCRILARHLARTGGEWRTALLRYNGGGDPEYPDRVLANLARIKSAGLFRGFADG